MSDPSPAPGRPELLRCERLQKFFPDGNVQALADVSLTVGAGEYVAVMGPSGSGKSTLLNLIGALDNPTSGEVYFQGEAYSRMASLDELRSGRIGFVFQSFYLLPTLTAAENVQVPMFERSVGRRERARKAGELLEAVGMTHRARHVPGQLSGGERQRVAIARAIANDPVLLLADEPTGNLDTKTGDEVLQFFADLHRRRRMTLMVVTHSPDVARQAGRLLRMRDGQLVEDVAVADARL